MTLDVAFRIILALLASALFYNRHLHRSKKSKSERLVKNQHQGLTLWIFVMAWLWTISLVCYAVGIGHETLKIPLPQWVRWVGVAVMMACFPLTHWASRALGPNFSQKLELYKDHRLVIEGPYAYIRHPMYSVLFVCATATCLISANYAVVATAVAVAIPILVRIRKEEAMMMAHFGDQYQNYRKHTGALFPKLLQ